MALFLIANFYIYIFVIFILLVIYWYASIPKNLPPGTAGLPFVGYLPFISQPSFVKFTKLANKYGPIFHLYLGNRLVVVLNDYKVIKEAYVNQADVFSGRIRDGNFVQHENQRQGIVNNDGEHWKQNRRFVLSKLRDNGFGKQSLEPFLHNEIGHFLTALRKSSGQATPMADLLHCTISNNINLLVTGNRYDYNHPMMKRMIKALISFAESGQTLALHTFIPWIACIPGSNYFTKHQERWKGFADVIRIAKAMIDQPKSDNRMQCDCLSDAYLAQIKKNELENNTMSVLTTTGLLHVCRDLLTAGTETSSTTLLWGMIYLTNHQPVQKKAQEEIDRVIGREREPSYSDRTNTPYTVAMINELHRVISLAPLGLPRRTTKSTRLYGYTIPKDTIVLTNHWAVNNNPKLWGDPDNFRPERFIEADGQLAIPEYFIPFSIGKRSCAGAPLAKMELYLYFTAVLQHFNIVSRDKAKLPLDAINTVTRSPLFDTICLELR